MSSRRNSPGKPILRGDIGIRTREIIREVCKEREVDILKGYISKDHVHIFMSKSPQISESDLVKWAKGRSLRKLLLELKSLVDSMGAYKCWRGDILLISKWMNKTEKVQGLQSV